MLVRRQRTRVRPGIRADAGLQVGFSCSYLALLMGSGGGGGAGTDSTPEGIQTQ
jgi:hypothetical protein